MLHLRLLKRKGLSVTQSEGLGVMLHLRLLKQDMAESG